MFRWIHTVVGQSSSSEPEGTEDEAKDVFVFFHTRGPVGFGENKRPINFPTSYSDVISSLTHSGAPLVM